MKYIFGPVNSRRLGRSLGIDLFSDKICNLNCVYCEIGKTVSPVCERGVYSPAQAIIAEIDQFCADQGRLAGVDVLTVTAKGEPTLHSDLELILGHIKGTCCKPLAVLTNGTTLGDSAVRQALRIADIVIPSLDAARTQSFRTVDRPAADMDVHAIVDGLRLFSQEYPGRLWLEILFVQGMNDAPEDIEALVVALRGIRAERIQLNTVARPPAESFARPLNADRLAAIADRLRRETGLPVDLQAPPPPAAEPVPSPCKVSGPSAPVAALVDEIVQMLRRRPCTATDIDRTFHLGGPEKVEQLLSPLVDKGLLQRQDHDADCYYQLPS